MNFSRQGPALLLAAALLSGPAGASPLDKTACAALAQDLAKLKAVDVAQLMAKGPDWAMAHLSQGDISLIRQYIDTDEQLKFRCASKAPRVARGGTEEEEGEEAAASPASKVKKAKAAGAHAAAKSAPAKAKAGKGKRKSQSVKANFATPAAQ